MNWKARRMRTAKACASAFALAATLAAAAVPATAETYPTKPIRLVVGFTAGGPTDVPARFIAEQLGQMLGQRVVVENKPGAGSMLATNDVLAQPRDGHTLLLCTYFDPVNTLLYRNVRYKVSDLVGISLIAKYDYGIALANDIPATNWQEFVAYARANPGKINYGHLGIGSSQNIVAKKLAKITGVSMTALPFPGAANALQEVVAGRNHLFVGPPLVVMPLFQSKQLKVIAVTGSERLASMPDVPTLRESGTDVVADAWLGVCAGSGTPQPIVDLLNEKVVTIVKSDAYRDLVGRSGSRNVSSTPQEFAKLIEDTVNDAKPIVQEFNLVLD